MAANMPRPATTQFRGTLDVHLKIVERGECRPVKTNTQDESIPIDLYKEFALPADCIVHPVETNKKKGIPMKEDVNHDPINPVYAGFIAIDWAKTKHDYCLIRADGSGREKGVLSHDPAKIHQWLEDLRQHFNGGRVALTLEQSKGPLINALYGYDFIDVYPINPQTSAKYRKMFTPSGAKNDTLDAASMLDLLLKHRDILRLMRPDTEEARKLDIYCSKRRDIVDRRTAATHRLGAVLESYYPQAINMTADDLHAPMSLAFLRKWPSLEKLRRVRHDTLRDFYHRHGSRSETQIQKRLAVVEQSVALTADPVVSEVGQIEVECLLCEIETLNNMVQRYDKAIDEAFKNHAYQKVFSSFPGAGEALAPRLAAAVGSDPNRYCDANALQKACGIAPIETVSNGRGGIYMRIFCPKFKRQTFHEYAGCSIQFSSWAKAYYEQQKRRGASSQKAKRALAFKWTRIIYRCWQDRTPYNENKYIESLKKRRSPLIHIIEELALKKSTIS